MVRGYEPGREENELDPRSGNFVLVRLYLVPSAQEGIHTHHAMMTMQELGITRQGHVPQGCKELHVLLPAKTFISARIMVQS